MTTYPYRTEHFRFTVQDDTDFGAQAVYLHRFIPDASDKSPFGGAYVFHADYIDCVDAERAADEYEWAHYPLERDELEPIPLVGRAA